MRQPAFACAMILALTVASACSTNVEEVRGSVDGIDAKISGLRNGTELVLVGDRTGPITQESVVGNWVRFKVPLDHRALADAPDQCLSIVESGGTPIGGNPHGLFRNELWVRARALREEEAQLLRSGARLQDEIAQVEYDQHNAADWLDRNNGGSTRNQCGRPPASESPPQSCPPGEEQTRARQFCKEAVVDCTFIAITMGQKDGTMFDSSFLGNQASLACSMQTAHVVDDEFGIARMLATVMRDPAVKAAVEDVAIDLRNSQKMEQFADTVLAHPDFAGCQTRAEAACGTKFRRWQADSGRHFRLCQAANKTITNSRSRLALLMERRDQLERQLAPIRQELSTLKVSGSVTLRPGC
jgi:hypothetical protein